jgi:hypothetical protein
MSETIVVTPTEDPKPSLKSRLLTTKNAKRAAITGGVVVAALWVKSKLNASGSVSADVHVESDDSTDN